MREPVDDEEDGPAPVDPIQEFWYLARGHARAGDLDVYLGPRWGSVVAPLAWSFGGDGDQALALVLQGRKTATTGLYQDYLDAGEPLPSPGELSIVLDGAGAPRALLRDTAVVTLPFGQVTPDQAAAEADGDGSLAQWRTAHRTAFARDGRVVGEDTLVVWERFEVLYQAARPGVGGAP